MLSGPQRLPKSKEKPRQLVVFLHGYGSNGENLIDIADYWANLLPDAEFISPNGLEPSEISPYGYQWFGFQDMYHWGGLKDATAMNIRGGLEKSAPMVATTIVRWLESRNLTAQNLALVGFSQGAMMALELMFHIPGVRSIVGYSGAFYPPPDQIVLPPHPDVFLVHGDADLAVPFPAFLEAKRQLMLLGIEPKTLKRPGLGHGIDQEGIKTGGEFLQQVFSNEDQVIYMKQASSETNV